MFGHLGGGGKKFKNMATWFMDDPIFQIQFIVFTQSHRIWNTYIAFVSHVNVTEKVNKIKFEKWHKKVIQMLFVLVEWKWIGTMNLN